MSSGVLSRSDLIMLCAGADPLAKTGFYERRISLLCEPIGGECCSFGLNDTLESLVELSMLLSRGSGQMSAGICFHLTDNLLLLHCSIHLVRKALFEYPTLTIYLPCLLLLMRTPCNTSRLSQ